MKTILIALCLSLVMAVSVGPVTTGNVKSGIQTTQQDVTYGEVRGIWKNAEEPGFYSAWNLDHFTPNFQ